MKKTFAVIMALAFLLSVFPVFAGGASEESSEKVTFSFFHRWANERGGPFVDLVIEKFEEANPDIEIEVIDPVLNNAYKEKIRVLVGSSDIPDVFMSWSGSFGRNLVDSGRVMPLDEMIAEDRAWSDKIEKSQWAPLNYDGKQYGIPYFMDGKAFFYNKDIFDKLGLKEPDTWDEFITILKTLQDNGYDHPISEGFSEEWTVSHWLGTMIQRMVDPKVVEKDYALEGDFSDPDYVKALNYFLELKQYMNPNVIAVNHTFGRNGFINQEGVMYYAQLSEIRFLKDGAEFDYSFFDMPALPGGKGDPDELTGAPEGLMISNECENKEAAEAFVKFFVSEAMGGYQTEMTGMLSVVDGAVNPSTATPKQLEALDVIKSATKSTPWLDNAVDFTVASAFMKGGQLLYLGEETAEEVMDDVQSAAELAANK